MSKLFYNYRVAANAVFEWTKINNPPTLPSLAQFTLLLWAGRDDEGWCVFRKNPFNGLVVRIDFYPPPY